MVEDIKLPCTACEFFVLVSLTFRNMGRCKVHVGKIPHSTTANELVNLLERAVGKGSVNAAEIKTNKDTFESKGFGFVTFNNEEAAERAAVLGENGHLVLLSNVLKVNFADRAIVQRPQHTVLTLEEVLKIPFPVWTFLKSLLRFARSDYPSGRQVQSAVESADDKLIGIAGSLTLPSRMKGTLFLSCFTNINCASWLWSSTSNLTTEFDFSSRKLGFLVPSESNSEKPEFRIGSEFEDISSIDLVSINETPTRALLIQLRIPPHVHRHKLSKGRTGDFLADFFSGSKSVNPYCMRADEKEEQWVRATDFTPNKSIGQCLVYLLKLPNTARGSMLNDLFKKLTDFQLASYPPLIEKLTLQSAKSFATRQVLVPIIEAPSGLNVKFELMFKVNQLLQMSKLSGPTLDHTLFHLLQSHVTPTVRAKLALDSIATSEDQCWEPVKWVNEELAKYRKAELQVTNSLSIKLAEGQVWVRRVCVTPTKVYCMGPEIDISNRVTRHYITEIDRFLRVSFVDENLEPLLSTALSVPTKGGALAGVHAERSEVYDRILQVLREGLTVGDQKFEFLAFSSSQLREQSVWMFASSESLTAKSIRAWMGDFLNIRNVAKCAARMGQCFSSSVPTLEVQLNDVEQIPDIEREDEYGLFTYCFSDGIGKISQQLATEVAKKYGAQNLQSGLIPSAFQIRYGGYKGVVAVDPWSQYKLSLRPSMRKFASNHIGLDILNTSRFLPSYLNQQIITLLSTLGVRDCVFEQMQSRVVAHLDAMLKDGDIAREVLQVSHSGEMHTRLTEMLSAGYHPQNEPYVRMLLQAFRASQLFDLRKKSRILVPKGRVLLGCLDETKTLSYGEVFLQVTPTPGYRKLVDDGLRSYTKLPVGPKEDGDVAYVVTGSVVVAKNPCLHPGDIRVLKAVDVPGLRHMVDCLVFPQNGHRPHPNECSGSDLDGDLYFVSWDKALIPPETDVPMDYCPPGAMILDHIVTVEEIQEFFVKYMVNDSLGLIANAHVVHADNEPLMARSPKCHELAKLVSIAVDFPKTGVPAVIPQNLRPKRYPDFMEKEDKETYRSERVLGKLFRLVKAASFEKSPTQVSTEDIAKSFDMDLKVDGYEDYIEVAKLHKNWYDRKLMGLMNQYGVETEAEAVSGNIRTLARQHQKRRHTVIERIRDAVSSLIEEARQWFERTDEHSEEGAIVHAKASAWYYVTYHPDHHDSLAAGRRKIHLLSFPWVVYDVLLLVKGAAVRSRKDKEPREVINHFLKDLPMSREEQ